MTELNQKTSDSRGSDLASLRESGRPQVHDAPHRAARCSHFVAHALPKEVQCWIAGAPEDDAFRAPAGRAKQLAAERGSTLRELIERVGRVSEGLRGERFRLHAVRGFEPPR